MNAFQPEAESGRDLLAAFEGEIEPASVSSLYRFGLLIVALAMILLPLIYVTLIFFVGYGVYYHALHSGDFVFSVFNGIGVWSLLFYLAPIAAGGILVLFMIKPLFVSIQRATPHVVLQRIEQPRLFDFIAKVCAVVRAPMPRLISVNCEVNASASFGRGLASFWTNDLHLTIGLPLVYGMSLEQLAGVFAHEFGHFAQGTGMRLTFLIRNINIWFARVVYERDAWDQKLVSASEESDFRIGIILHLARFFVWITRKILWALMMAGHFISSFMLRQMEYDADRYEARLVGSATFAGTVRQLRRLNAAQYGAFAYLNELWKDGRLANDLSAFIATELNKLSADFNRHDEEHLAKTKTGVFDTHPCDQDRIASTAREAERGVFRHEAPATALFENLDEVSRQASRAHYQLMLGDALSENNLVPNAEFLQRQNKLDADHETATRFFQNMLRLTRPLVVVARDLTASANAEELIQNLRAAREYVLEQLPEAVRALQSHELDKTRTMEKLEDSFEEALNITNTTGVKVVVRGMTLPNPMDIAAAKMLLQRFETEMRARLASALRLLHHADFSHKLAEAKAWRQEVANLLPALEKYEAITEDWRAYHLEFIRMNVMLNHAARLRNDRDDYRIITRTLATAFDLQNKILKQLAQTDYPFEHTKGKLTLAQYALTTPASGPEFQPVFNAYQELSEKLFSFYYRAMGRLAVFAEQVETAAGLEPLPMPEPQVNRIAQNQT